MFIVTARPCLRVSISSKKPTAPWWRGTRLFIISSRMRRALLVSFVPVQDYACVNAIEVEEDSE
jgi:hypothetical protein